MAEISSLISNAAASGAYRSSQGIKPSEINPAPDQSAKPSFSELVANAESDAVDTIRNAEAVAQAGLAGKTEAQQVVEATLELDTTVKVAVSVRDKLVEAYQEIMRMPI